MPNRQRCTADDAVAVFNVPSSSSEEVYEVSCSVGHGGVTCTCPGFRYRKSCKHIVVETHECGWLEGVSDEKQNGRQNAQMVCPKCGSTTEKLMWGEVSGAATSS